MQESFIIATDDVRTIEDWSNSTVKELGYFMRDCAWILSWVEGSTDAYWSYGLRINVQVYIHLFYSLEV